jgi:uncharacterized protein YciI
MLFAIICVDKPDSGGLRSQNRPAHLDHLKRVETRIALAGPTLTEDRSRPTGSLLILDFESREEAEAFAAADPYNKAGVFESVTITPFKQVFPAAG